MRCVKLGDVRRRFVNWDASSESDPALSLLPGMLTDISLSSKSKKLIIDAKYYKKTLNSYHNKQTLHSANLYQLLSYIDSCKNRDNSQEVEGMLLYPVVSTEVNERYIINGKRVYIHTLDLAKDWKSIREKLTSIASILPEKTNLPNLDVPR